jgi:hypothetical protein
MLLKKLLHDIGIIKYFVVYIKSIFNIAGIVDIYNFRFLAPEPQGSGLCRETTFNTAFAIDPGF